MLEIHVRGAEILRKGGMVESRAQGPAEEVEGALPEPLFVRHMPSGCGPEPSSAGTFWQFSSSMCQMQQLGPEQLLCKGRELP